MFLAERAFSIRSSIPVQAEKITLKEGQVPVEFHILLKEANLFSGGTPAAVAICPSSSRFWSNCLTLDDGRQHGKSLDNAESPSRRPRGPAVWHRGQAGARAPSRSSSFASRRQVRQIWCTHERPSRAASSMSWGTRPQDSHVSGWGEARGPN